MTGAIAKVIIGAAVIVVMAAGVLWTAQQLGIWNPSSDRAALGHPVRDATLLGTLPEILNEASGVAVSRAHDGLYWTHNDSGDGPVLYAISATGELVARYTIDGVEAEDWEDITLGPCPESSPTACLYVADTGDNRARRGSYAVVIVPEPTVVAGESHRRVAGRAVGFVYPDGAHDAEAVTVTPTGDVIIVTRGRYRRIGVYELTREQLAADGAGQRVVAQARSPLSLGPHRSLDRGVTGAALSPDGATLAVRTLSEIYMFPFDGRKIGEPPTRCVLGDLEPQGEAVDFLDDSTLVLVSEARGSRPGTMHRVRCP